jgi:RNA polymerase sigma-70 factor, ECF subfamily
MPKGDIGAPPFDAGGRITIPPPAPPFRSIICNRNQSWLMIQRFHSGESDPLPEPASELESLIEASAAGNRAAFSALYDAAAPQLFGLALRILKRRDWAEDVLQEALISAWRNAGEYRRALGSGKAWLTVILRNRALDRLRREATARLEPGGGAMLEVEDPSPSALDLTISGEAGRRLMGCLEQLEEVQKRAILMAYFEGLTHEELAARIASPLGTVKSWIRRGLQRLKGCLES